MQKTNSGNMLEISGIDRSFNQNQANRKGQRGFPSEREIISRQTVPKT